MKKITTLLILLCSLLKTNAQLQLEDTVSLTIERWRDSVFRMDKTQVPTGILLEYSMLPFDWLKYDGVNNEDDTIRDDGHIFVLHNILAASVVNSSTIFDKTDTIFARAFYNNKNTGNIPLTFIFQPYNRIRQTSLSEGLFKIAEDSVGILDVANRTTSPYNRYEFFAFAPFKTSIVKFNAINFSLPNELWLMPGITNVSIDFGDGTGFRNINKGGTVSIYYPAEGKKIITAQISTTNGIRTARCEIDYKRPGDYVKPDSTWNIEVDPFYTDDNQYLGGSGARTGDLVIPCSNTSFIQQLLCSTKPNAKIDIELGCDKVFDKPIIIVEGFDPDGKLDFDALKDRFGKNSFRATMKAAGYDFVYVDFTKNGTYIENNAKVLEAVINKVNQSKVGTFKSSVIGFSMGGLIARWCLKDMEDRGLNHQVANYFSYDAPQQGANVPLGLQYIFKEIQRDLPYLRFFKSFRQISDANESSAARQMLVTKASYNNGAFNWNPNLNTLDPLRSAFAQRLQAKGYPQQTNNYGLAFGRGNNTTNTKDAGNGVQWNNFVPGTRILKANLTWFLVNFQSSGYAVPENGNTDYIARYRFQGVTFRKFFGLPILPQILIRTRNFKYTGYNPYDDAPGSFDVTQSSFVESLNYGMTNGAAKDATTDGHDGHNFVSVSSALDLQNQNYGSSNNWQSGNMFGNIDNQIQNPGTVTGNTLVTPSLSPFKAVITSTSDVPFYNYNIYHNGDISDQFSKFIIRKILNAVPAFNCTNDGFCNLNPTINGPSIVCSTGVYNVNNLSNGLKLVWSSMFGSFNIINGQGTNQVTISKLFDKADTLILSLTNSCGTTRQVKFGIQVGAVSAPLIQPFNYDAQCGTFMEAYCTEPTGATGYVWNLNFGQVIQDQDGPYTNYIYVAPLINNPQQGRRYFNYLTVQAKNACGLSASSATKSFTVGPVPSTCSGGGPLLLAVSPNPSSSSLNVSANNMSFNKIRIIDKTGMVKKQFNYPPGTNAATINISDLSADVYNLLAFDGVNWTAVKFIKN